MTPMEQLRREHQIIMLVLDAFRREAIRIRRTYQADVQKIGAMVDFFWSFTHGRHQIKEEKHLFEKLDRRGLLVDASAFSVLLREHEEGRRKLRAALESLPDVEKGRGKALASLEENLTSYIMMLRMHILKENTLVYPRAEALLGSRDLAELAVSFEEVDSRLARAGMDEMYHSLASWITMV